MNRQIMGIFSLYNLHRVYYMHVLTISVHGAMELEGYYQPFVMNKEYISSSLVKKGPNLSKISKLNTTLGRLTDRQSNKQVLLLF